MTIDDRDASSEDDFERKLASLEIGEAEENRLERIDALVVKSRLNRAEIASEAQRIRKKIKYQNKNYQEFDLYYRKTHSKNLVDSVRDLRRDDSSRDFKGRIRLIFEGAISI